MTIWPKGNILWVNGWGVDDAVWRPLQAAFPDWEHRFVDYADCRSAEDFRTALREAVSECREPCIMIGWSMGALLAAEFALDALLEPAADEDSTLDGRSVAPAAGATGGIAGMRTTPSVKALVLIGGTLAFASRDRTQGWPPRIVARMRRKLADSRDEVLRDFLASMLAASERASANAGAWGESLQAGADSTETLQAGLDLLLQTDLRPVWRARSGKLPPVLWLHGQDDAICPPGAIPEPSEWPVRMQVKRLTEAGHAPHVTRTKDTAESIRSFLNAIPT